MGNRSSESLKDKPDELEIDDLSRHSKLDLDVFYRIPDLEKSLSWRLEHLLNLHDPDEGELIRVRILDDSEPGVDMYEGIRPLICVETVDSWPKASDFLIFGLSEDETHRTELVFEPALKIKLTEEGKKVKKAERSTSTVCTWHVMTARSRDEMKEKLVAFMGVPWPTREDTRRRWPMVLSSILTRRS